MLIVTVTTTAIMITTKIMTLANIENFDDNNDDSTHIICTRIITKYDVVKNSIDNNNGVGGDNDNVRMKTI
jgi:hypothetical protein